MIYLTTIPKFSMQDNYPVDPHYQCVYSVMDICLLGISYTKQAIMLYDKLIRVAVYALCFNLGD